jgi:CHAT domain-containing protein
VEAARDAVDKASRTYAELQARIRNANPRYAALMRPRALSLGEIQRELIDPQTLLLEFRLGEKQSWLWCVSADRLWSFALPARAQIEKAGREIYGLLTARQPRAGERPDARHARIQRADRRWLDASRVLSDMLLGRAAAELGPSWPGKRLLVIGSGVLEYLPFAALPDPWRDGRALVESHEIVYAPSASVISVIRQDSAGRALPAKKVAVLADPIFERDDPRVLATGRRPPVRPALNVMAADHSAVSSRFARLPFSREEARAIEGLVPAGERLVATGFNATLETAASRTLADYRIVHFATHGVLDTARPEASGLVLSLVGPDGRAEKGFLGVSDIYNLHLPADLIVLSGCQTALGKEIRGEGIIGLTRGFMYAGARRVVASLWQVDDLATAELMRLFYRGMLQQQLPPAAALRAAQRQLAARPQWSAPFYWAGFVMQGEWKAD